MSVKSDIKKEYDKAKDGMAYLNDLREYLHEIGPLNEPVDMIRWVDVDEVQPNDYNPNSVAQREMQLLYLSIKADGYTQPIVTIYDDESKKYVIIDGFHRYHVGKTQKDIQENTGHRVPIVVLKKDINDRMSATVRHNRARGEHSVKGMANMVFTMLENGWTDEEVCRNLGMSAEEVLKLKHVTGFSKLFKDAEYRKAWDTVRMVKIKKEYEAQTHEQKETHE